MSEQVRAFLLTVLRDVMKVPVDEGLDDDVPLGEGGLELESLAFAELAVHTETEFGAQIPDDDIERIVLFTVGEYVDYVATRLHRGMETP